MLAITAILYIAITVQEIRLGTDLQRLQKCIVAVNNLISGKAELRQSDRLVRQQQAPEEILESVVGFSRLFLRFIHL